MASKVFLLRTQCPQAQLEYAHRLCAFLVDKGIQSHELDDLVFHVADSICERRRAEIGDRALATEVSEFEAANEINAMEMQDQVILICAWFSTREQVRAAVSLVLRMELPEDL